MLQKMKKNWIIYNLFTLLPEHSQWLLLWVAWQSWPWLLFQNDSQQICSQLHWQPTARKNNKIKHQNKCTGMFYRIFKSIDDMSDSENDSTGMACQPWTLSQLFFSQVCQESKVLSSDFRVEFEEFNEDVHPMECCIVQNRPGPTFLNFIDLIQTLKIVKYQIHQDK